MNMHDIEILSTESKHVLLDSALATDFVENHKYYLQRPLGDQDVQAMVRSIEAGAFPLTTLTFCAVGNDVRLIDGFHRASSVRKSKKPLRCILNYFVVPNEEHRKAIWRHFDTEPGRRRSNIDIIKGEFDGQLPTVPRVILGRIGSAMPYLKVGFSRTSLMNRGSLEQPMPRLERTEMSVKYLDVAEQFGLAIAGINAQMRTGFIASYTLALTLAIFEGSPSVAHPFVRSIALNDGLPRHDPKHKFHEMLQSRNLRGKDVLNHALMLAYCWNLHVDRETRSVYRLPNGPIPLKGTPYIIGHENE